MKVDSCDFAFKKDWICAKFQPASKKKLFTLYSFSLGDYIYQLSFQTPTYDFGQMIPSQCISQ